MALGDAIPQILLFAGPLDGMEVPESLCSDTGLVRVKSPAGETVRYSPKPGTPSPEKLLRVVTHLYQKRPDGRYVYQTSE